jgi:hypothetical protein
MSYWTTKELDLLKAMHAVRIPSIKELMTELPRHSEQAVLQAAKRHKLIRRKNRDWLKIAQQYSAERGDKALVRA